MLRDIRFGLRLLISDPGFSLVAILALALGIGATTGMFSVINTVLLRPLNFPESERTYRIAENWAWTDTSVAYPNFRDWRERNVSFASMAAFRAQHFNLARSGQPERIVGMQVSAAFFPMLGATLVHGRVFNEKEDQLGAAPVAVISESLWRRKFGARANVMGQGVSLDDKLYVIIGVVTGDFQLYGPVDVYVPIEPETTDPLLGSRAFHTGTRVIGKLKSGVTVGQALENMRAIAAALETEHPDTNKGHSVSLILLQDDIVGNSRSLLSILFGAVAFVLLVACANVANLLISKSIFRQKEIAVRTALGAARHRIMRQLLTEAITLAVAGGAIGLLIAYFEVQVFSVLSGSSLARLNEVKFDSRTLLFSLSLSIFTALLFGMLPALQVVRQNLNDVLKREMRGTTGAHKMASNLFVITEIALAMVLLTGAGLLLHSFVKLNGVQPGFNPHNVLSMEVSLSSSYSNGSKVRNFYRNLLDRIRSIPGVEAAGATTLLPLGGDNNEIWFYVNGRPKPSPTQMPLAIFYVATPGYADALEISLLRGRFFNETDNENTPRVAVIDDRMANEYFPGQNPVGQQITLQAGADISLNMEIVGVVGHVKQQVLDTELGSKVGPQLYFPFSQLSDQFLVASGLEMNILARTRSNPESYLSSLRTEVAALDTNIPLYNIRTMDDVVSDSISTRRSLLITVGSFAMAALVLALIGIYGVISQVVSRRTHELGIRMALGADEQAVVTIIVLYALRLILIGLVVGAAGSALLTIYISSQLYGIHNADPLTYGGASFLLVAVGLLASYFPARRAAKLDPAKILNTTI